MLLGASTSAGRTEMTEWKRYELAYTIQAHRTGWRGAFDAIVSAITGRPRVAVPTAIIVTWHSTEPLDVAVVQVTPDNR